LPVKTLVEYYPRRLGDQLEGYGEVKRGSRAMRRLF
jgi:hypothetical protein